MFDDQVSKTTPPANLPSEPADMFAGVEKDEMPAVEKAPDALGAGLLKKKDSTAPVVNSAPMVAPSLYEVKQPILGKVLLSLLIVVVLGGAGYGGWYAYNKFVKNKNTATDLSASVQSPVAETTELPAVETKAETVLVSTTSATSDVTAKMNNDKILFGEAVDSDKDGLDDVREKELGTDAYNADTDSDGLSDGDEVIIWKTNPLNPDTDGDSYKDGQEVRNGYNPLGAGKLFNVPAGVSTSTATTSKTLTATTTKTTVPKSSTTVKIKK